jgi:hypothetical protein
MVNLTSNSLTELDPAFQPVAQAIVDSCNAQLAPSYMRVTVTYRSPADQNAAEACGKSKASAGQSPHDCVDADGNPMARAFDFAVFAPDGTYITRGADARYAQCGTIAKAVGQAQGMPVTFGGDWTPETDGCEPDFDHCEMTAWRTA